MNTKTETKAETETLNIRVFETVEYVHTIELTDELLNEAEAMGYDRDASGVFDMLEADPDLESLEVVRNATVDLTNEGVSERTVGEF